MFMKTRKLLIAMMAVMCCASATAQGLKFKGVLNNNRYDDGDQLKSTWIGSLYDEQGNYTGKTAFIVDYGIYAMNWDGESLTTPTKEPAVNMSDIKQGSQVDYEKALWATNFNLMMGNSGAVYVDGIITTIMSRDYQSTEDDELFAVRQWDAKTGNMLTRSNVYYHVNANLESAGMSYNPKDGKVYGLFHFTNTPLNAAITGDPEYFTDQDDADEGREGLDDGYAIATIDLETMEVTQVTPGLYYGNYVAFAINSDGRAFALTSGGSNGYLDADGKMHDINDNLTGANLCEFDLATGLMKTVPVMQTENVYDDEGNITGTEQVEVWVSKYLQGTGYASQVHRQSACFSKSNPNILYWNGFLNSGKGVNENGSWSSLSDKEWRTNGKYDTALYAVNIEDGSAQRLSTIKNRCSFSCLWVDGDDCSDGAGKIILNNIESAKQATDNDEYQYFSLSGVRTNGSQKGLQIIKHGNTVRKVQVK